MAASVANSRKALTSGANTTTCASFTSTTGDTIYVTVSDASGQGGLTITDNKGNTYTQVGTTQTSSLGGSQLRRYVCQNANGGSGHTVTATWAANSDAVVCVFDLTGVAAASLDKSAQADDSSMPWGVTSPTLSQADEIAIASTSGSWNGTFSESTGFNIDQQEGNNSLYWTSAAASKVVSATTALSPSFSVSGGGSGSAVAIDTFKAAAAGGGGITGAGQIASGEAIGSAGVAATVAPAGVASGEAFGSAAIGASITAAGIASGQAIGQPAVAAGISATGIASGEAFGAPTVQSSGVFAVGIPSAEAFGQPALGAAITAAAISSAEAVGRPVVGTSQPEEDSHGGGIDPDEPRERRRNDRAPEPFYRYTPPQRRKEPESAQAESVDQVAAVQPQQRAPVAQPQTAIAEAFLRSQLRTLQSQERAIGQLQAQRQAEAERAAQELQAQLIAKLLADEEDDIAALLLAI